MEASYYIGVDVGTTSVRAGIFTHKGQLINTEALQIDIYHKENSSFYEQSSNNIWTSVTTAVKNVVRNSCVNRNKILGIGFDATTSLVVLNEDFNPIPVDNHGNPERNIIMWMDHRANKQTEFINSTNSPAIKAIGGKISLEMQLPKILWLKQNMKETWASCRHLMEIADFCTWRSTGKTTRSLCSLICKWVYQKSPSGISEWPADLHANIGLSDVAENNYEKFGNETKSPGDAIGNGLTVEAAEELGLNPGTAVAAGIIDAYAGCLGALSCDIGQISANLTEKLVIVAGTSTCLLSVNNKGTVVPGIWGPYYSAIFPDLWVYEPGQSSAGGLIDHIIHTHPVYQKAMKFSCETSIYSYLNNILNTMTTNMKLTSMSRLTQHLHMWPDYHGNRSPLSDDKMTGMLCGLTLSADIGDLALKYLATLQALAYGARHILDKFAEQGKTFKVVLMSGGLSKNELYMQVHADVLGLPLVIPQVTDTVLLGSAILAAKAAGSVSSLKEALKTMGGAGRVIKPFAVDRIFHDKKYSVFRKMMENQLEYRKIMETV